MKSKKIIVLLTVLLLMGGSTTAFGLDLTVGGKGIVGHNFFSGKDYKDDLDDLNAKTEFRFGYSFGAFVVIGITPMIAIQPELMFSQFGGKFGASAEDFFDTPGLPGDVSGVFYNSYLEVPVLAKLRFNRFSVFVGPDFLIKLGDGKGGLEATNDTVQAGIEAAGEDIQDLESDALKSFVINGIFGVGYDHPLGPGALMIDARYMLGLSSATDPDSAQMMDREYKENSIKVSVGYGYQLK